MSLPGRPKGEYRNAKHEGSPVSLPGRPEGKFWRARLDVRPLSLPGARPKADTGVRSMKVFR